MPRRRAVVARMAGATFEPYPQGVQTFKRIVVGGQPHEGENVKARQLPAPVYGDNGRIYQAIEYTLEIPMEDGSFASFAKAEQIARDKTWDPGAGGRLGDAVPGSAGLHERARPSNAAPGPARRRSISVSSGPPAYERLYVLGGCADLSREAAEQLLRPLELMEVGSRSRGGGRGGGQENRPAQRASDSRPRPAQPAATGDVREDQAWMRVGPQTTYVKAGEQALPVLGRL